MFKLLPAVLLLLTVVPPALARDHQRSPSDRSSFGGDIVVEEGTTSDNIACAFCSVHLHGGSKGDVAVFFGSVTLDEGQSIKGDVAVFGGDVWLEEGARIGGDLALMAGSLHLAEGASTHGDRAIASSKLWMLVPFVPLFLLIGLIWLIVWIVRRNRDRRLYAPPGVRF